MSKILNFIEQMLTRGLPRYVDYTNTDNKHQEEKDGEKSEE